MLYSLRVRLLLTLIIVVAVSVGTVALFASRVTANELERYVELDTQRNQRVMETLLTYYQQNSGDSDPQAMAGQMAQSFGERVILTDSLGAVRADSSEELNGLTLRCDAQLPAIVVTEGSPSCIRIPAKRIGYGPIMAGEATAGDILFIGMPITATSLLDQPERSAAFSLQDAFAPDVPQLAQTHETMAVAIGPGQQSMRIRSMPAITIRRVQGSAADPIQIGFIGAVNRSLLLAAGAAGLVALLFTVMLSRGILGPVEALTAAARRMEKGDLSQRVAVRAKDEIGELARAFNAMADGLARIEQLRRHMVTDVAHELRTPLTNIRGYLEALRDGVAEPSPELIGSLHEEALLLNRLVDDLQDLALAEAGQLRLARRPTSLCAIVEGAVSALQPTLAEKNLTVDIQLADDLPCVDADAERVGQVLRNLLNNAITHTPASGSITLQASAECRVLSSELSETLTLTQNSQLTTQNFVVVRVSDTGAGIAPEHLSQIFERFYRADPSRARATGGAGLGLTIVRQLVEAHGGQVWASSKPGQGATFAFTLPVAKEM